MLAEVKANSRIDFDDDDALLGAMIAAAVSHLDGWTGILGRCLCQQTWRQDFDCFERALRLPLAPVISVESVKYDDADGVERTVDPSNYRVLADERGPAVVFVTGFAFPGLFIERPAVRVSYVAGYPDGEGDGATTVPDAIRHAILMIVAHWYENREEVLVGSGAAAVRIPMAADALLAPFRRVRF
jgi:uncharacterized phiE125 gp8 family phage protein